MFLVPIFIYLFLQVNSNELPIFFSTTTIYIVTGVIEIFNKVIQTVTKTEPEDAQVIKVEPNHEGLWKITPFEETQHWFLKTGQIQTRISIQQLDNNVRYLRLQNLELKRLKILNILQGMT